MKAAFLWESFGPYHFARFEQMVARQPHLNFTGIEVCNTSRTYAWKRSAGSDRNVVTLFPGETAESVSAGRIYRALVLWLDANAVDVLLVPSYWPLSSFAAALAARRAGSCVVLMTDSHYASGKNGWVSLLFKRWLVSFYDSAFVAGSQQRAFMRLLGMPEGRIFDGYDTVDNDHFSSVAEASRADAGAWRAKLDLPPKYILSLGRLVTKKNLETVVQAYARLVAQGLAEGNDLVFVGSGEMKPRLVALARELGMAVVEGSEADASQFKLRDEGEGGGGGPRKKASPHAVRLEKEDGKEVVQLGGTVRFYPFAQIDTVPVYYGLATAFVLASTKEEWGLVVNEAMASGCPTLVSSAVGCAPDLVEDGKTGYIFDPDDVATLSDRMARLCCDSEHAKAMGRAAQIKIADWSCERFAKNAFLAAKAALGDNAKPKAVI